MSEPITRRTFATLGAGLIMSSDTSGEQPSKKEPSKGEPKIGPTPVEAPFERDYEAPKFTPAWKKPQINRLLVQDFVIYAHTDLGMVKKLLEKEPGLINATMDWGGGDWETALGAGAHMGRRDIVEYLLEKGARMDIFCATMLGLLDAVKAFLTLQPKLIDAKGPHGFSLHFHAQLAGKDSEKMLEYLQSIKKVELKPNPFVKKDPPEKK
ncbi:MAG: ankyrin repeat domain-containing protein [Gemmataceae bacterium]|jgi:hypothetical protein|nr:ankyrin repeat domain-containing protein [Gemmataceae bacterium]